MVRSFGLDPDLAGAIRNLPDGLEHALASGRAARSHCSRRLQAGLGLSGALFWTGAG
jgi:hypothetical protein